MSDFFNLIAFDQLATVCNECVQVKPDRFSVTRLNSLGYSSRCILQKLKFPFLFIKLIGITSFIDFYTIYGFNFFVHTSGLLELLLMKIVKVSADFKTNTNCVQTNYHTG